MKHILITTIGLLMSACGVESNTPVVYDNDAGPQLCGLYRVHCEYGDPLRKEDWHCYWQNQCWDDDAGVCSDSQQYCWIVKRTGQKQCKVIPGPTCI